MHDGCRRFILDCLERIEYPRHVLEIGGRDVNGSVRPLFSFAESYTSVDRLPGPGVDVVADGETYQPAVVPDLVLCLEVLEHAQNARGIVRNAWRVLAPGGALVITCAGPGRFPHGAVDGGPLPTGEFYRNVEPAALLRWLLDPPPAGQVDYWLQVDPVACDVRLLAQKVAA